MFNKRGSLARYLLIVGVPFVTGLLLAFHPIGDLSELFEGGPAEFNVYNFIAPVADRFIIVHTLFAPAIALMAIAVHVLLQGVTGIASYVSRIAAFIFAVSYIVYESIVGTASGVLVRAALALPIEEQAVMSAAINRLWSDPLFGDTPSVVSTVAILGWTATVISAAIALRRVGKPLGACIMLAASFLFAFHAPPLGPIGLILFMFAAIRLERGSQRKRSTDTSSVVQAA